MTATVKAYKGMGMEGFIAKWYAQNTAKSASEFAKEARRVAAELPSPARVLEVAPGPGYFAIELAKLGDYEIIGLDISKSFVKIATENAEKARVRVEFRVGNAAAMPLESDRFDFVFCRAAFKNFTEPVRALQEMHRVLKPGGRARIIDLRRDASIEAINDAVGQMNLTWFDRWITRLTFRFMLIKRAYRKQDIAGFVARTEFRACEIQESGIGLEIRLQK